MLKKCWGVAGASIISTCLNASSVDGGGGAMTVFDPTSSGRPIYAIFGFFEILEFDYLISNLKEDVITLINDVAVIVHEEVQRCAPRASASQPLHYLVPSRRSRSHPIRCPIARE
jgi:hypothetical protein